MKHRKLITLSRIITTGISNFVRNAWLAAAAMAVMVVTLTIVLFSVVTSATFNNTIAQINDKIKISVYLNDSVTKEQADELMDKLRKMPSVRAVSYVSKDEALAEFRVEHNNNKELLQAIGETGRDGPYFVSSLQPLSPASGPGGDYLFQDLSAVPPELAAAWTKEFLNQAAQQRFWVERTWPMMGLRIRTMVSVLATDLEEVRRSVGQLIRWRGDVPNRQ